MVFDFNLHVEIGNRKLACRFGDVHNSVTPAGHTSKNVHVLVKSHTYGLCYLVFLQQVMPAGLCMCYTRSAEAHLLNIAPISNNLLLQKCMHGLHESICTLSPTQQRSKSLPEAKANTLTVQGSLYLNFKSSPPRVSVSIQ